MKRFFLILGFGFVLIPAWVISAVPVVYTGDFNQPIPASGDGKNWMDPVTIDVDRHMYIADFDVGLTIEHPEVSDLRILMDAPWGATIILKESWELPWRDPRSNMTGTVFDDESPIPMELGSPPYTGRFQPMAGQYLSAFDGRDAFGRWTLRIEDVYLADAGRLKQWSLIVEPAVNPEPTGISLIAAALMFLTRRRWGH